MMMTMKKSLLLHKTQEVEVEKDTAMNSYTTASVVDIFRSRIS